MKTLFFSSAIALMMMLNLTAKAEGTRVSNNTQVQIFQTNKQSVDVYVAKAAGDLVKIKIYSESGTQLMTARVKKQKTRYIRFHLNELPEGNYKISVEKDNQVLSSLEVSK
ncbi:MAG: hypothetical protein IPN08_13450 [Bacteroidales bacterium]|nr:hypothetical protein [Bacteroidales bacterium]MBK9358374.1 hypothetical protein [Bacteroidales bacterium]